MVTSRVHELLLEDNLLPGEKNRVLRQYMGAPHFFAHLFWVAGGTEN